MDILGPLPRTLIRNYFVLVTTDHYMKSTQAVPTSKTTVRNMGSLLMETGYDFL